MTPSAASVRTPSAKRTVSRTCLTQYPASATRSGVAGPPVTFEISGMRGGPNDSPSATRRKRSSIGSISGEWKAWLTRSRRVRRPSAANSAASRSTAASSPASTSASGALTAATDTPSGRRGVTSSSVAWTATIAPPAGSSCMSRARAATSVHASSRDSTPATWAAVISPIEWPATASGRIPQDSTSRNSATSIANNAGWAIPVSSSAAGSSPQMASRSGRSSSGSSRAATASNASANTPNLAYSSRPMPGRCDPCPENSTASRRPAPAYSPRATSATSSPLASSTARCGKTDRPASEKPTSTGAGAPGTDGAAQASSRPS